MGFLVERFRLICGDVGVVLARFVLATGSRVYAAPEVVDPTKRYDGFLADVFSCGIILYAMITAS